MKQFVYPAVFYFFEEENVYTAAFPDMNLYCEGDSIEDTFLKAKTFLYTYCLCSLKLGNELDKPSKFLDVKKKYEDKIVQLVDCEIKEEELLNESNFFDENDIFEE